MVRPCGTCSRAPRLSGVPPHGPAEIPKLSEIDVPCGVAALAIPPTAPDARASPAPGPSQAHPRPGWCHNRGFVEQRAVSQGNVSRFVRRFCTTEARADVSRRYPASPHEGAE